MITTNKPIYLQIVDHICNQIIEGKGLPDEKIPTIRELSVQFQVNPNTTFRGYERLEQTGVIYVKRGQGYFVSANAKEYALITFKQEFYEELLPEVFLKMKLYGIDMDDIETRFEEYMRLE